MGLLTKEVDVIDTIVIMLIAAAVGVIAGYFVRKNISEAKIGQAENLAKEIIDKAARDSETVQKEKLLEAKEEIHKWRTNQREKTKKEEMIYKSMKEE